MTSTDASPTASTMLDRAESVADELFTGAQDADRAELLTRDRFSSLADAGMFGIAGPSSLGFADLDPRSGRRVIATIGGGCGATFFSWVQHHGVVRTMRASDNDALRDEHLAEMCAGRRMAGVAFAHLRRRDRRVIEATRVPGGWRLDGSAPWATSWGIADVFAIAAESVDGEVVWVLLPGEQAPGFTFTKLDLPVFSSTGTVALHFDGLEIPDDRVMSIADAGHWRITDRSRAALGQPAVMGVTDRAIRLLDAAARGADDPAITTAAGLRDRLDEAWERDGELLAASGQPSTDDVIERSSDHRWACLDLAQQACTALLAAVGGAGMDLSHPAQRLAREASFYVIQAQTADGRDATLRNVGRSSP